MTDFQKALKLLSNTPVDSLQLYSDRLKQLYIISRPIEMIEETPQQNTDNMQDSSLIASPQTDEDDITEFEKEEDHSENDTNNNSREKIKIFLDMIENKLEKLDEIRDTTSFCRSILNREDSRVLDYKHANENKENKSIFFLL